MAEAGLLSTAAEAASFLQRTTMSGYRVAPALMLCLVTLLIVPLVVVSDWIWLRLRRLPVASTANAGTANSPTQAAHAHVEFVGQGGDRVVILGDMLRIGREDDNDIRIAGPAVHRYHAAIHREDFGTYHITDFSGNGGNGMIVNGRRCEDARLHDGDVIELGSGRLRFHAGLV